MRGFGKFLIFLGVLAIIFGIVGLIYISSMDVPSGLVDSVLNLGGMLGATSSMTLSERFIMFCVQNRTVLLICGIIGMVAGIFMKNSAHD